MTAATVPAAQARAWHLPRPARLLRLELRRNLMPWLLPLFAALFWLATYRPAMAAPPLWDTRGTMLQAQTMLAFAPLLAGAAAWAGSREGRRGTGDLVDVTGLPRWAGRLAAWAAVTCWAEAVYLAGVAVVYGITAHQATWGGPLWWPIYVGAATAAAACAVGFAAGALTPSRFTAPLAAVVVFLALGAGAFALQHGARPTYSQIWPLNAQGAFPPDAIGIFYPYLPDLAIAQLMFVGGLGTVALGALGLPAVSGGRWLRSIAAAVTVAGLAAAGTAVGLAGTARLETHGIVIPALHDAASDRPVAYTPVCSAGAIPVCLHPAFRGFLPDVTAAVTPVLHELAGLPGAPVRVTQVAVTTVAQAPSNGANLGPPILSGHPAVLYLPLSDVSLPGPGTPTTAFIGELRDELPPLLNSFVGLKVLNQPGSGGIIAGPSSPGAPAQIAVAMALAQDAGLLNPFPVPGNQPRHGNGSAQGPQATGAQAQAAAQAQAGAASRFAALPAATRHAWLLTHLSALRAGDITLSEIP